jgi:hypothetical protein
MRPEHYRNVIREIVREVVQEELSIGLKTPGDLRIEGGYLDAEALVRDVRTVMSFSITQLRNYERGDLKNLETYRVTLRMQEICKWIKTDLITYRAAVRRQMDDRAQDSYIEEEA